MISNKLIELKPISMENTFTRRQQQQQQSSPRLLRSKVEQNIPTIALPPSNSQRFTTTRSKSTTKSRTTSKNHEDKVLVLTQNKGQENVIRQQGTNLNVTTRSFAKLLPRGSTCPSPRPRISSVPPPRSPSEWALSPGRYLRCKVAPAVSTKVARFKSSSTSGGGGSGVSGVLKYFRLQKKVSPIQEEDFHRFRLLHNRLLQWRFANARAEASLPVARRVSQVLYMVTELLSAQKRTERLGGEYNYGCCTCGGGGKCKCKSTSHPTRESRS